MYVLHYVSKLNHNSSLYNQYTHKYISKWVDNPGYRKKF